MCSILLVEDHSDTRQALAVLFKIWGHQVFTSESAAGGLAFLNKNNVDVILSDIGLPDRDGYDFISEVRQNNSQVIAIAVSASFNPADQHGAREAGFDMYFSKPVDLRELQFALGRLSAQLPRNAEEAAEAQDFMPPPGATELRAAS